MSTEKKNAVELHNVKENLHLLHEAEIDEIISKYQVQMRSLEEEISTMGDVIQSKKQEIEQLIKEKVAQRGMFDSEIARLEDDNAILLQKLKDTELKASDCNAQAANRLADRERHIEYL